MPKLRLRKPQSAQAMVEFALVLPILLLLILGIFAFGHLFFVYSSVVSASREAARWGAAVGEAPSSAPRYQDCTSIRASAVRVGTFAGISPNSVTIDYDAGPTTAIYDHCPLGGSGPADVGLGDRIVVTVTVNYTPIVPFVNLPSFPLTSTTARTIVKSLPVGDAPVAVDPCITGSTITVTASVAQSVVGQPVTFHVVVSADDPTALLHPIDGTVFYSDSDGTTLGTFPLNPTANQAVGTYDFHITYWNPIGPFSPALDPKLLSFTYSGSTDTCIQGRAITDYHYLVEKANTQITLNDPMSTSMAGYDFNVSANVVPVAPGGKNGTTYPTGNVVITAQGFAPCTVPVTATGVTNVCTFHPTSPGTINITASYVGDGNYNASSTTGIHTHTVIAATTPTIILTPTTAITPTATSVPAYCPYFASNSLTFLTPPNTFDVGITNPNTYDFKITKVKVSWPTSGQTSKLKEIHFDNTNIGTACANNNHAQCIWWANNNSQALSNANPLSITSATGGNWSNNNPGILKGTNKTLRLIYTADLSAGQYFLEVEFADGAGHQCITSPAINYQK